MKIAYFDCFAGISGDMCLGALVDAGADISEIEKSLKKLPIDNYRLIVRNVLRAGISATKVDVLLNKKIKATVTRWKDIERIINNSSLDKRIKQKGLSVFRRLFQAEARVHGESLSTVHLHELGGVDCMVDIFGTLIGLDILGVQKVYASSINLGSGTVKTGHGILPVPGPATAELLKGYPVYSSDIPFELTTPTGAAIISGLKSDFLPMPHMRADRIGYGAGNKEIATMPNTLRILVGDEMSPPAGSGTDNAVTIIETNIDDMNPQIYEDIIDKLFRAGALDVFLENIIMKKSRPAVKLTVIADGNRAEGLADMLFKETTTIGVRFYRAQRKTLDREVRKIKTVYGDVRIKLARLEDAIVNVSPEYKDLKSLSKKTGMPIKKLAEEILLELKTDMPARKR